MLSKNVAIPYSKHRKFEIKMQRSILGSNSTTTPRSIPDSNPTTTLVVPKFATYKVGASRKSPYFYVDKHCFYLTVFPQGYNERSQDYVSLWIKKYAAEDEMLLELTCSVVDDRRQVIHEKTLQKHLTLESFMGWTTFCRRSMILDEHNKALNGGSLTLECRVVVYDKSTLPNAETEHCDPFFHNCLTKLSDNLKDLLSSGMNSDCTLKVEGKEFHVHKGVLGARSEAFRKLLLGKEALTINSRSADSFQMFLEFLYSGSVGHLTVKTALELYDVSVTFEVVHLRNICSEYLKSCLEKENIFNVLLCAHTHSDKELLDVCLSSMNKNLRMVKGSPDWIKLMKTHPDLANRAIFYR